MAPVNAEARINQRIVGESCDPKQAAYGSV
jgi:hypothetical protein